MKKFSSLYRPLTSRPFLADQTYTEYQPCESLRPYIACYWSDGKREPQSKEPERPVLVIPDTCIDLMIQMNHTTQQISGRLCMLQEESFLSIQKASRDKITSFAIRFHFWAARLFFNLDLSSSRNQFFDLEILDREWRQLFAPFFYLEDIDKRIKWVEKFLLGKINLQNAEPHFLNSVQQILGSAGSVTIRNLCEYSCVSQRQMERIFLRETGISPKRLASLVRYQNVWREMATVKEFDVQDAVYRYGYTDQAHLLKEFKRFHGVTPETAKRIAYENQSL